jgi:hypothetical protein
VEQKVWNIGGEPLSLDEIVTKTGGRRDLIQRRLLKGVRELSLLGESPEQARRRNIEKHKNLMMAERHRSQGEKRNSEARRLAWEQSQPRNKDGSLKPSMRYKLR